MFPREMVILMAIVEAGQFGRKLVTQPMDITGEYIGYLYASLVRRGYLKGNSSRGYQLTVKGREAVLEFLSNNRTNARDRIKALQQLRIEIGQEIDKLKTEATAIK